MINTTISLEFLNKMSENNMVGHLGIEFTEVMPEYICAKMPVDHRTKQPMGLLHGGASVVAKLAWTIWTLELPGSPTNSSTVSFCLGQVCCSIEMRSDRFSVRSMPIRKSTSSHYTRKAYPPKR